MKGRALPKALQAGRNHSAVSQTHFKANIMEFIYLDHHLLSVEDGVDSMLDRYVHRRSGSAQIILVSFSFLFISFATGNMEVCVMLCTVVNSCSLLSKIDTDNQVNADIQC